MLFEPHIFFAQTNGVARKNAVKAGVAYPKQGQKPYPKDSYPHLLTAIDIDQDAALKSASWGIGQVLGENYVAAGYRDILKFVNAMINGGEAAQLQAAINFIKAHNLSDELRSHNWDAFARGYNGPNYAKNDYANKLRAAYKKWSAIRDTPWPQPGVVTLAMALNSTPENPVAAAPVTSSTPLSPV